MFFMMMSILLVSGQNDTIGTSKIKADSLNKDFLLFRSDDLLEVTNSLNITKYIRMNTKEPTQDTLLTFHFNEKDSLNKNIRVKYRSKFRFDNCGFPPMEVSFKNHIHAFPYLNQRAKKDIISLLNKFYNQLEDDRSMEFLIDYLKGSCKQL